MRYFLIDDLRAEETRRLCEHLDAMDLGAGLDGIYWLPIPAHMLSAVQKEHESQCGPYVMALECEETSLRLELLVRARLRAAGRRTLRFSAPRAIIGAISAVRRRFGGV